MIQYDDRADSRPLSFFRKTPSIHMPRWACRLWLELTDVRVERLQAISAADAREEGISIGSDDPGFLIGNYMHLWESINGPGSWALNPWVWVLTFRRVER